MSKNIRKTIRFSEEEYLKIEQILNEHKLTFTEFSRGAILKKKITTNLSKDLLFQVNKIGNNLNQITKKVHQNSDQKEILNEIKNIKNQLGKLLDVC